MLFGIGIRPALDALEGTGLVQNGVVPVNGLMQTDFPDIYAAGDIVSAPDPTTGQLIRVGHWVVAERQGQHAARSMLGAARSFTEVPFFWTMQQGASLKYGGYPGFDQIVFQGGAEGESFLSGYFQNGSLRAAATIGRGRDLFAAVELIKRRVPLSPDEFQSADLIALLLQTRSFG